MPSMLTISIDYDDTFTADPDTWSEVIRVLQRAGHRVICISARRNEHWQRMELQNALPEGVKVYLSYDQAKAEFARQNGESVDIWIDDFPSAILQHA